MRSASKYPSSTLCTLCTLYTHLVHCVHCIPLVHCDQAGACVCVCARVQDCGVCMCVCVTEKFLPEETLSVRHLTKEMKLTSD